jgi:hypothetical protein
MIIVAEAYQRCQVRPGIYQCRPTGHPGCNANSSLSIADVTAVEADGFINPSGGIGAGWSQFKDGQASGQITKEYTVASGLSAPVFTWMSAKAREDNYRVIARNALRSLSAGVQQRP